MPRRRLPAAVSPRRRRPADQYARTPQLSRSDYKKFGYDYLERLLTRLRSRRSCERSGLKPDPSRTQAGPRAFPWRPDRPRQRSMEPRSACESPEQSPGTRRMTAGADPPALPFSGRLRARCTPARLPWRSKRQERPGPTPSAAAGSPPAAREPLSPCTDGARRASGLTLAFRLLPTG